MPVTGIKEVRSNMRGIFKDIREKKAPEFIAAVMSIGAAKSKELAPIEYGTLVNSIIIDISNQTSYSRGTIFYMANYAAALEFGIWKPVAAANKQGPADNMSAEPHFLRKGFESPESKTHIKQAEKIFKV